MHRDYTNPTDLIIKIYDDSIEITNPGKLMGDLTVKKLFSGNYVSIHRNKLVTEAFYLTGDIEKQGTGFKRIKDWFKGYPKLSYQVNSMQDFVQVAINVEHKNKNVPLNVSLNVPLNERQKSMINDINKNSDITQVELAKKYKVNERTIKRDLQYLQEQNIIKRRGSKKSDYWEIIIKE